MSSADAGPRPQEGPESRGAETQDPGSEESRSQARAAARERARELREQRRRRERRRAMIIASSVVLGTIAAVAIVALVLLNVRPGDRGPLNMRSDGIKVGEGLVAVRTAGLAPGATPVPSEPNPPQIVDIRIYYDYLCADCGAFFTRSGDLLRALTDSGAATVEFHPIAVLTTKSAGTQYSLRAANAAACVANYAPDDFFAFNEAMFDDQPQEGTPALSDEEIVERAQDAGVGTIASVRRCVQNRPFEGWVRAATERALAGPIPGADIPAITTPLTILVNGRLFQSVGYDAGEFGQFIQQVAGQTFVENPTPTPEPSATPSPTP